MARFRLANTAPVVGLIVSDEFDALTLSTEAQLWKEGSSDTPLEIRHCPVVPGPTPTIAEAASPTRTVWAVVVLKMGKEEKVLTPGIVCAAEVKSPRVTPVVNVGIWKA